MKQKRDLHSGRIIDLGLETHTLPDGRSADFEVVRHPGGAAVLPELDDGRLVLIRQFRPAADGLLIEIPAGRLESGEAPQNCAARELQEEAGYRAGRLEPLGTTLSTPGFCDERIHLFLGLELEPVRTAREQDEFIELLVVEPKEALRMLSSGEIVDAKTQLALLFYLKMMASQKVRPTLL